MLWAIAFRFQGSTEERAMLAALVAGAFGVLLWTCVKGWKTELTGEGVRQPEVRGRGLTRWADVSRIYRQGLNIVIEGDGRRLLIVTTWFRDLEQLEAFIDAHLPPTAERSARS
jgi:hypothetical protein